MWPGDPRLEARWGLPIPCHLDSATQIWPMHAGLTWDLPVPFPCGQNLYPWEFKIGVCSKAWGTRRGEPWGPSLDGQVEGAGSLGKCVCV